MALAGALCVLGPALHAQTFSLASDGASRVDVGIRLADVVSSSLAPAFANPVVTTESREVQAFAREATSEFGGVALHSDVAPSHDVARSDEESDDEKAERSGGGGIGMMPVLGALAGGGALVAVVANASSSSGGVSDQPLVSFGSELGTPANTRSQAGALTAPEPASVLLLGAGTLMLAGLSWRRRRA
ncbi:MAG: PEP-CTERM sorting domain-containing protein [Gemmatimonadaceae bacterium]|nr:PEP-CTERM sorting domain-containing protein [Gemmatimonadaceae bacterium]